MPFVDKTLTCVDCGQQFTFTADDQEFFASRGFGEPNVCANCGQATQVPFQPRGDRPVYCRECFAQMGPSRPAFNQRR